MVERFVIINTVSNKEELVREARSLGGSKGSSSKNNPFKNPEKQSQFDLRYNSEYQSRVGKLANPGSHAKQIRRWADSCSKQKND